MNLSPLDIRHAEFPQRFGGYERAAVRAFLNDVAEAYEAQAQQLAAQQDYLRGLEKQLEERKAEADEIRRAVVAAERIAHELRENAARESELLIAQATTTRDAVTREAQARAGELEATHGARMSALEAAFRTRFAELERAHHDLVLERDRAQAQRLLELERDFSAQHADLSARLGAARQEYQNFVGAYRTLMSSFSEMSARHVLAADLPLGAPRLAAHEPQAAPLPGALPETTLPESSVSLPAPEEPTPS